MHRRASLTVKHFLYDGSTTISVVSAIAIMQCREGWFIDKRWLAAHPSVDGLLVVTFVSINTTQHHRKVVDDNTQT